MARCGFPIYVVKNDQTIMLCRVGPLINCWCMRMESKNSYFKQAAQVGGNFKNVPYSIARHHQRLMCGNLQGGHFFSYEELECGPCKC